VLARDWSGLTTTGTPCRHRPRPIPRLGHPAPQSAARPRHGLLGEEVDGYLEWLYLLHPDQQIVVVYEATCHARWLRHSLHHLDPVDDLFVTDPDPTDRHRQPMTVCTVCGAVDEIEHHELPSMTGAGCDTSTACLRCGSAVTTDPMFGTHVTRRPWPPTTAPPAPDITPPQ
jgi:hypothetical protein